MKQLLILLFVIILFTDCNNNKSWSAAEKQQSLKLCMDEVEGKLGDNEAKKFCSCLMEKAMRNYPSYEAADKAITDEQGKKMGQACIKELGIGVETGGGDEDEFGGDREKKKGDLFDGSSGADDDNGDGYKKRDDMESNRWTSIQRESYIEGCTSAAKQNMSISKAGSYCECMQKKVEKKYKLSFTEANKLTEEDLSTADAKADIQECLGNY